MIQQSPVPGSGVTPHQPPRPTPAHPSAQGRNSGWFLGLDLNESGLGAVLLHRPTQTHYALRWVSPEAAATQPIPSVDRLPITVYFAPNPQDPAAAVPPAIALGHPPAGLQNWVRVSAVQQGLDLGLPYYGAEAQAWEPVLQLRVTSPQFPPLDPQIPATLPLIWVRQALDTVLQCLNPHRDSLGWHCTAEGLVPAALAQALEKLEGIGVAVSHLASEAYAFNVREAVLAAGLVRQPDQVYFLEGAIAALLPHLHDRSLPSNAPPPSPPHPLQPGSTLILHLDQGTTELALVSLPPAPLVPSAEDFLHGSLAHGEQALNQDIISQLLYPLLPEDQLDFDPQHFPVPGEADRIHRSRFQHYLTHSALGNLLLEAATQLRLVLQHQEQFTLRIGAATHILHQTDLITKVLQPYFYCLNSLVNQLLSQGGWGRDSVAQVVVLGNPALVPHLATWLHQKFPQAQPVDFTSPTPPTPALAVGLALLPLYPQLFNAVAQYSDLFLLLEILRAYRGETLTLSQVCQRLEARGINTYLCHGQIQRLLQGTLPKGLVPDAVVAGYFTPESWHHGLYATLRSQPLFLQPSPQTYQVNPSLYPTFQHYWQTLVAQSWQSLEEPYLWPLSYGI